MARLHAPQLKMRHLVLPWLYTVMLGALFLKGI
jgi:hypothetical protein